MIIYIAGKVTGEPIAQCTMKFGNAQVYIESIGHQAINPLQVVNDWKASWKSAMRMCIASLLTADAVVFLPDSPLSRGATIEKQIAEALDMKIFYSVFEIPKHEKNTPN